jgi:hypothetical protein
MRNALRACFLFAATILTTLMLCVPGMAASERDFVFVPQADSPGNDYARVNESSFDDCAQRSSAQSECNAFAP